MQIHTGKPFFNFCILNLLLEMLALMKAACLVTAVQLLLSETQLSATNKLK